MDNILYTETNYNLKYNNDIFYNKILIKVKDKLKRKLTPGEINEVVSFIKKIDPNLLKPEFIKKTEKIMINTLVSEFKEYNCSDVSYADSQQIIRDTIGVSSESNTAHGIYDNPSYYLDLPAAQNTTIGKPIESMSDTISKYPADINLTKMLGMNNSEEIVRVLNPGALLRKNYMVLDTRYRIPSSTNNLTKFSWNYILHDETSNQGTVNVVGNVRDIVAIRVYPFRIPYILSADNKYDRITMLIEELSGQAFIAHESRKFHFMLKSGIDSNFINLKTNKYNDGFFYFEKPITTLNTITVSFGSPLEPIVFENDSGWCAIDYFSLAPLTKITTYDSNELTSNLQINNLLNGDAVYFENFRTGYIDPLLTDQVIIDKNIKNEINRKQGFLITVVDATSFTINYDTSNIQNPVSNIRFNVYYGSKRMFIPFELTYIQPNLS